MRPVLFVFSFSSFVLVAVACKAHGASETPGGSDAGAQGAVEPTDEAQAAASQEPEPPQCDEGGRAWDGRHGECPYEVAGCCYDTPAAACGAAQCDVSACQIMEISPAQVNCRASSDAPTS